LELEEVQALMARGRQRGFLTYVEIQEALAECELLDASEIDEIYRALQETGVRVMEEDDVEEEMAHELDEEQVEVDAVPIDDSVRMYLRDIGRVPLLTAAEEVELARRIQKGEGAVSYDRLSNCLVFTPNHRLDPDTVYTVTALPNGQGWKFSHGGITKDITLPETDEGRLKATYDLTGLQTLYVRFGLSPHLEDLLVNGQTNLSAEIMDGNHRVELVNEAADATVRAYVQTSQQAIINEAAIDVPDDALPDNTALRRRDQAQVHQVEVELTGAQTHEVILGFDLGDAVLPDDPFVDYMDEFFPGVTDPSIIGPDADPDGDGLTNYQEFLFGTDPNVANHSNPLGITAVPSEDAFHVAFDTIVGRVYQLRYTTDLTNWNDVPAGRREGSGQRETVSDEMNDAPRKFYRVEVSLP